MAAKSNFAVASCDRIGFQAPLPFPIEGVNHLWFPPAISFAELLLSKVSAPTTTNRGDSAKFHKELRAHMANCGRLIRHQDCHPLGKPEPSAQMKRKCRLYRFCVCKLQRLIIFREELVTVFRTWFRPRSHLRKALDMAYLTFELASDNGHKTFYHIGISNLLTYQMSLLRLVLDDDPVNQQIAHDAGNIALRACNDTQVALALGNAWKQLGVSTVPETFALLDLDRSWSVRPALIALGPDLRDAFRPCEVEIAYAGEAKTFWWSYSGVEEAEAAAAEDGDAQIDGFDETDDSNDDPDGSSEASTDQDEAIINPADDEAGEPPEDSKDRSNCRRRQPAWRRRVQRCIARVAGRDTSAPAGELDEAGYGTDSDADILASGGAGDAGLGDDGCPGAPTGGEAAGDRAEDIAFKFSSLA